MNTTTTTEPITRTMRGSVIGELQHKLEVANDEAGGRSDDDGSWTFTRDGLQQIEATIKPRIWNKPGQRYTITISTKQQAIAFCEEMLNAADIADDWGLDGLALARALRAHAEAVEDHFQLERIDNFVVRYAR